nr:hypothetical protein GCM10020241_02710 [Streptoalloteichus tenebrarius]
MFVVDHTLCPHDPTPRRDAVAGFRVERFPAFPRAGAFPGFSPPTGRFLAMPAERPRATTSQRRNESMPHDFNQRVIDEFRAHRGRVGPPFENARLLLL